MYGFPNLSCPVPPNDFPFLFALANSPRKINTRIPPVGSGSVLAVITPFDKP